jgi:hypothetical protein
MLDWRRQLEPFAICPAFRETPAPIGFDAGWIVGSDRMEQFGLVGRSDTDWLETPFRVITATDLVEVAGFDEIHLAAPLMCSNGRTWKVRSRRRK